MLKKTFITTLLTTSIITTAINPAYTHASEKKTEESTSDFRKVAREAIPAVVAIRVKSNGKASKTFDDQLDEGGMTLEEFWQKFFGVNRGTQREAPVVGQASGFIISSDGYILTNAHVVKDMSEITVITNDEKEYPAKVIGDDTNTDIALIKIEAKGLPYLKLGNSDDLEVGQWVAAIGNPLGLQASLTRGVVSAKGRNNLDLSRIEDYIQTDAAINRGNSGGPLLDLNAQVIGMNTAIVTNMANGGYMGIGFAIPSNLLKAVMEDLKTDGSFKRGFLGVSLQQVDNDLAQAFGLDRAEGALVAEVSKNSPADKAGLKHGDIILKLNNIQIQSIGSLRNAVSMMKPGSKAMLAVLRHGKPVDLKVEIGLFPSAGQVLAASTKDIKLGLEVENLPSELASKLGINGEKGVVVSKVEPSSPASWVGIKKGAVILEVNKKKIASVEDYNSAMKENQANPVLLLIKQGDVTRFVSLKLG